MNIALWQLIIPAISTVAVAYISIVPQIKKNNKDVLKEFETVKNNVEAVKKDLNVHIDEHRYEDLKACRSRMVRFLKEVNHGDTFDSDAWNNIYEDVKYYQGYCTKHPGYKNGYEATVKTLDDMYQKLVMKGEVTPKDGK